MSALPSVTPARSNADVARITRHLREYLEAVVRAEENRRDPSRAARLVQGLLDAVRNDAYRKLELAVRAP